MKLTKSQIQRIKTAHKIAESAANKFFSASGHLAFIITETTGIQGNVDYLHGDAFGFTPASNNHTHVPIEGLIKIAEMGLDITEDVILDNLSI